MSSHGVHPGGYYAWQRQPESDREIEDKRLSGQIKQCWLESGGHSGYCNIHEDLLEADITCGRIGIAIDEEQQDSRLSGVTKRLRAITAARFIQQCLIY